MKLYIGNKNYSSWSFRVWLTMVERKIDFEEDLQTFNMDNGSKHFLNFSPSGKVPVLQDKEICVWESLAILEYLADKYPKLNLWPAKPDIRALARAIAHEMHGGFFALRSACPMNMRRAVEVLPVSADVQSDVSRIETIWSQCLAKYGGPFLFGNKFTIADGMYAPIVNRLHVYKLSDHKAVLEYTKAMTALKGWKAWTAAAELEPWTIDIDEVYA